MLRATIILLLAFAASPAAADPCEGHAAAVVVDTSLRQLYVCESGEALHVFGVAIGQAGVGKTREGDRKTPLGVYRLGRPRASRRFGTFIPVGYPTTEQRRKGYTGSAVGIHGPKRSWAWLGRAATLFGWTRGCIAVATHARIKQIADWVNAHPDARVHLLR